MELTEDTRLQSTEAFSVEGLSIELLDPGTGCFTQVLSDVSVTLWYGVVVGITGPSGGGKSTLVAALSGLLPSSARVRAKHLTILGQAVPVSRVETGAAWNRHIRQRLGRKVFSILQDARSTLFPNRTVSWHLRRATRRRDAQPSRESLRQTMASLGFSSPDSFLERFPSELSTGECQRIQWALAWLLPLDVVLMDEPFASVSQETADSLADKVRKLATRGSAVLLVSHQLRFQWIVTDELLTIESGRVSNRGPAGQQLKRSLSEEHSPDGRSQLDSSVGPFIRLSGLDVQWGGSTLLHNRYLEVGLRSRTGILGPSGAGKTTLARVIMGLLPHTAGVVERLPDSHPEWTGRLSPVSCREFWKQAQIVIQDTDMAFDPTSRLGGALTQIARAANSSLSYRAAWGLAGKWLAQFGLGESAMLSPPLRLSGGEKRRAAIVQALLSLGVTAPDTATPPTTHSHERLLILDEPTVGLDHFWQETVARQLQELQESLKLTVLAISHDRRFVHSFCTHVTEWT